MGFLGSAIKTAVSSNPIGVGLGALSLGAQVFGAIKSGKANQANENIVNGQIQKNEAFYNNNNNYFNTNEAKSVLETARKRLKDNNKTIDNTAAVTGGTAEATIAAKGKNNEGYSDTVRNLAAVGTRHTQNNRFMYNQNLNRLMSMKMGLNQQKSNSAANAVGNAGNLFSTGSYLSGFKQNQDVSDPTSGTPLPVPDYENNRP